MAKPTTRRFADSINGGKNVDVSAGDATFDPPVQGFIASAAGVVKVDFAPGYSELNSMTGTAIIPVAAGGRVNVPITKIYQTGTTGTSANIFVID